MYQQDTFYMMNEESSYSKKQEDRSRKRSTTQLSSDDDCSLSPKRAHMENVIPFASQLSASSSSDDSDEDFQSSFMDDPISEQQQETKGTNRKSSPLNNEETTMPKSSNVKFQNNKVFKMMSNMNWDGKGLGKFEQGRQDPIEASKQKGRRGLGFENKELQEAYDKFNPDEEIIKVEEPIEWLGNLHNRPVEYQELQSWMVLGPAKRTIEDETNFCDAKIVKNIVDSKSVFDKLDKNEMRDARTRSNPFETIRGAFFLNRAAVKMANIDRACDFMFTRPHLQHPDELLYFADVCAGPGGFSEYVLWRKKWHAKGFGFTLKRSNDFKLEDFYAGPCETFHPYYGPSDDINKQGDIFLPENQSALRDLVMQHTDGAGVHFMMSDGGFSVEGQENIQEILSKQLYLCQCLVALMIVREGGHFVTKLFDLFTPFSVGLVYLMYRCFDSVSVLKPNTSRPANSERYLICKGKRSETAAVEKYLMQVNKQLLKNNEQRDVLELVPLEILQMDHVFFSYLKNSNEELGKRQITGLLKIAAYAEDKHKIELRQAEMSRNCLQYWELPIDKTRTAPRRSHPDDIIQQHITDFCSFSKQVDKCQELTQYTVESIFRNFPYNWFFAPCEYSVEDGPDKMPTLYMSTGRSHVYEYRRNKWKQVLKLELPPKTLVYGEIVTEFEKEGRNQRNTSVLHIMDAYMLGEEDISREFLPRRHMLIRKFCKALWKPDGSHLIRVRPKDLLPLDKCLSERLHLQERHMKKGQPITYGYTVPDTSLHSTKTKESSHFFIPRSIMFLKCTTNEWNRCLSRKHKLVYYSKGNTSLFEKDMNRDDHKASFVDTFNNRVVWNWPLNDDLPQDKFLENIMRIL